MIPDSLILLLMVACVIGAALSARATSRAQERLGMAAVYLIGGLVIIVGAVGMVAGGAA